MRPAAAVLLSVWLAACAGRPPFAPDSDYATPSERQMFRALKEVGASDKQRIAAMEAWDNFHPRLEKLAGELDAATQDWRALDRRDPGYASKSAALSNRCGVLLQQRMAVTGRFQGKLAAILTQDQWERWQSRATRLGPGASSREGSRRP